VEVRVLHRQGQSVRAIAKELGCSRNTVRRYLREAGAARYGPRAPRRCKLDPYKAYVLRGGPIRLNTNRATISGALPG
jgi:transposase